MTINNVLFSLLKKEEKNIVITDEAGEVLYVSERTDCPKDLFVSKLKFAPDDTDEWEFFDKTSDVYFRVNRNRIEEEGKLFICYSFTDVSEYTHLMKDVLSYTKGISNMSKFQTSVMKKLSMPYDTFLPGLAEYCGAEEVVMYIKVSKYCYKSRYKDELVRNVLDLKEEFEVYFSLESGESRNGYTCIVNSGEQEIRYVVLIKGSDNYSVQNSMDVSVHNVIRLFIENSIMRERIVYESEHDKLTGLFNKGKYMSLKGRNFGNPESIAIFNFDVNNLKYINDNYGHEMGDELIIKAAKSIAAMSSEKVKGFRMGGDEYLMVAVNITKEEAEKLKADWEDELRKLNEAKKDFFCVMACGMTYGSGDYNYDELFKKADELMYENKKDLKARGILTVKLDG